MTTHDIRSALLRALESGPSYGLELMDKVRSGMTWGLTIQDGNVYPELRAMEQEGLIESYDGEPVPERGGRPRRYYRLTPKAPTHDELHAKWKALEAKAEADGRLASAATARSNASWRESYLAELAVLILEDRGQGPRATWLRAHLEGRWDDADLALAALHPESEFAQEAARRVRAYREARENTDCAGCAFDS